MANDSEGTGGSGSVSSGQGRRRVRQRTSSPQQASQQAPQQSPQQNPREAPRHGSRQAAQHALQQAPQQAHPRACASKPDPSEGALAGSARQSTGLARRGESSLLGETRQRSTGSPERPSEDTQRQRTQQPSAGASGAQIRRAVGNSGLSSTNSPCEPSMKLTLNVVPGPSSLSTPPRGPPMGPSAIPSGGSERHHTAAPGTPPRGAGAAVGSSTRPSLRSKPQLRPPGPSPGPEPAARPSTGQPLRPMYAAGRPSSVSAPRLMYTAGGHSPGPPPRPMYTAGGPSSAAPLRPMYASGVPSSGPLPRPMYTVAGHSAGPPPRADTDARFSADLSLTPDAAAGRKLSLSIETEFYLATPNNLQQLTEWERVRRLLVDNYNQQFGAEHPRMRLDDPQLEPDGNQMWRVDQDFDLPRSEIREEDNQIWWRLTIVSPAFDIVPHSAWKHHVRVFWRYLSENFSMRDSDDCYTRFRVYSLDPPYTIAELKRVACSIVHFETAIEALQPENLNDPGAAGSIWLHSSPLAQSRKTRQASIDRIDECSSLEDLWDTVHANANTGYAWNLWEANSYGYIEFRQPAGCLRPPQVFMWAEFTLTFILAAMRCGSPRGLRSCLQKIGALKQFVAQVAIPGAGPYHLDTMWEGKNPHAAREPMMCIDEFASIGDELELEQVWRPWVSMKEMIEHDARTCVALVPRVLQNHLNGFSTSP